MAQSLPPGEPPPEFVGWEMALRLALRSMSTASKLLLGRRLLVVGKWLEQAALDERAAKREG